MIHLNYNTETGLYEGDQDGHSIKVDPDLLAEGLEDQEEHDATLGTDEIKLPNTSLYGVYVDGKPAW